MTDKKNAMQRIAIIGGHGKVALHLARTLSTDGLEVSSLFRNPDHTDDVAATGAEPVVADIESLDTDALAGLLVGHDAVVFTAGAEAAGRGRRPRTASCRARPSGRRSARRTTAPHQTSR